MPIRTLWKIELGLMSCVSLLHLVQLVLYPINAKWFVALIGGIVYATASLGIARNRRYAYFLATFFPVLAALFVVTVLALGVRAPAGGMRFNPFTAIAAVVEMPAVVLGAALIRRSFWRLEPGP